MKKGMKKAGMLVCLIAISACVLVGCTVTDADRRYYGTCFIRSQVDFGEADEQVQAYFAERGEEMPASVTGFIKSVPGECYEADLLAATALDRVHYLTREPSRVENAVIVTKWMYYSALIRATDVKLRADKVIEAYESAYCMEKLVLFTSCYVCSDPNHPESDWKTTDRGMIAAEEFCDAALNEPVLRYPREIQAAAAAYYGLIDGLQEGPVDLEFAVRVPYNGLEEEPMQTYRIVGYVETEADRLLSTGVSMDKTSPEYQTVVRQITHPVIYVIKANS